MTENTAKSETVETAKPTEVDLKAMYDALPEDFKSAVDNLNAQISKHNGNVDSVKQAAAKDPKLIKAEIFEQNPMNNAKLAKLRKEELKVLEQLEGIRKQAYEVIDTDGLMPRELTEEEVAKLKTEVSSNAKELKDQVSALEQFEKMMPHLKGNLLPLVQEIKTQRGTAKATGKSNEGGIKRPRFKRIEVNGVTADESGNTVYGVVDGNEKYTFGFASQFLRKQHKGIKWTANDLQEQYFGDKSDQNDLPEIVEFTLPYTYKNAADNEETLNYTVKCYR